jgi:hypothetical protein
LIPRLRLGLDGQVRPFPGEHLCSREYLVEHL